MRVKRVFLDADRDSSRLLKTTCNHELARVAVHGYSNNNNQPGARDRDFSGMIAKGKNVPRVSDDFCQHTMLPCDGADEKQVLFMKNIILTRN